MDRGLSESAVDEDTRLNGGLFETGIAMMTIDIQWSSFFWAIAPWGIPLCAAFLILLVGNFLKHFHLFSFSVTVIALLASIWLGFQRWLTPGGEEVGGLLFDSYTYLFVLFFLIGTLLTTLLSFSYLKNFRLDRPEYYALLLFAVFGMGCMASASELMIVFLGLEIMSISVYVLAGFQRSNTRCVEAAIKYFLIGAFASSILLLGIAFIYGAAGTTNLLALHEVGAVMLQGSSRLFALLGLSLIGVGFAFKIAAVPFHFWAADVYEGSPVVVTNFMATVVKLAAFAALLRVIWALFQWVPDFMEKFLWIAAALTMTVGNIAALRQKNLKRMLAYSSVAHAGYALIPLVAFLHSPLESFSSVGFYLLAYLLMTSGAFGVLIALSSSAPREFCEMHDLAGLGFRKPFLGFAMTVLMLSLAGIPPTIGFFGKYYMFLQAIHAGFLWLAVIGVINSVISVYYYLTPVVTMYFGKTGDEEHHPLYSAPLSVVAVVWFSCLGVLLFGLFPSGLLEMVRTSMQGWLG
ncbi:MAG: NADH-quinone oxidoreductase subunit N [Deltaproteobacteria bacterium]|nr:NADH-quinone oxidoreductase subunit N [Deltaproteobacteria bacterium]